MKKLFFAIGLVICITSIVQAQQPPGFTLINQKYQWTGMMPPDTAKSKYGFGAIGDSVYWGNGTYWRNISRSSSSGNQQLLKPDNRNYTSDSVLLYELPVSKTMSNNGWTIGSAFNSNTTQTVVGDGVESVSAYTGSTISSTNIAIAPWLSMINTNVTEINFTIQSFSANAEVGIGGMNRPLWIGTNLMYMLNFSTGGLRIGGQVSASVGTTSFSISAGDQINFKVINDIKYYSIEITNQTKNKADTFYYENTEVNGQSPIKPGYYQSKSDIIIHSFNYYGIGSNAFMGIIGDSRLENDVSNVRDSILANVVRKESGRKITNYAKGFGRIQDGLDAIPEFRKMKFDVALVQIGWNDVTYIGGSWQDLYKALIDSLVKIGCRVVIAKDYPSESDVPTTIGDFIQETYSNNPNVTIIDFFHVPGIYDASNSPYYRLTSAYRDGTHLNGAGGDTLGRYIAASINKLERFNVEGLYNIKNPGEILGDSGYLMRPCDSCQWVISPLPTGSDGSGSSENYSVQSLTDGSTITWDVSSGINAQVTIGSTGRTLSISNAISGHTYTIEVTQGSGGGKTITTWPSGTTWPGGAPPTLSTSAGAVDIITLYYNGTNFRGLAVNDFQ